MAMIYSIHSASIRIINRCEMREWTINLKCAKKGVNCIMFKVIEQRWSASKVGILYSCASNMFKMRVEQAAINCASISAKKFDEMCWDWIGLDWMGSDRRPITSSDHLGLEAASAARMPKPASTVAAIVYFHALGMLLISSSPPRRCLHATTWTIPSHSRCARDY